MHNYDLIFINSLLSSLVLSMKAEYGWFAALEFGDYDMRLATAMAFSGAILGNAIDFAIGYIITVMRSRFLPLSEDSFMRAAKYFRRYVLLLLLFPWIPFTSLFALAAGVFRVPPALAITIIMIGRIGYYSFYLLQ